jgi:CelD/BcsL family acetyltransferase involved in cellulose biosynthesis
MAAAIPNEIATNKNGGTGPAATVKSAKVAQDTRAKMPIQVACEAERAETEEAIAEDLSKKRRRKRHQQSRRAER